MALGKGNSVIADRLGGPRLSAITERENPTRFSNASGYDAVVDHGRRKRPSGINRSEDQELTPYDRWKLYSGARDIARNFAVAGWMIRQHLDYVSTFTFRPRCKSDSDNQRLQEWWDWWSLPENCDAAGRHDYLDFLRLCERSRVVDGDLLVLKLANGRLQAIEGDRIRTPPGGFPALLGLGAPDFLHGVTTDKAGKALQYAVCRRAKASDYQFNAGMFYFEALVDAADCWHHGYFDRFDQVRGVSPIAQAMNALRDVYEGVEFALAKMKISQIFALALYRQTDEEAGSHAPQDPVAASSTINPNTDPSQAGPPADALQVDFGRGPTMLDLDPGDKAEVLESRQPSLELQQFIDSIVAIALKSLDIPFSFYKENFTNYSGGRDARTRYEHSARIKRRHNTRLAHGNLNWRLDLACEDGELDGTPSRWKFDFLPSGCPWIDPLKEVQADTAACSAGFTSRSRVCREQGTDFTVIAQELAEENKLLEKLGLPTTINPANVQITEIAGAPGMGGANQ